MDSKDISLLLAEISTEIASIKADVGYIKERIIRNEDYVHHVNKRLQKAENTLSFVKGAMWIFLAVWSVVLAISTLTGQ
tara:strand:+ start:488 stop:724 length:237 start_codon:yes stop_codon:yes gene_type:complete